MSSLQTTEQSVMGAYPEREAPLGSWLDRLGTAMAGPFVTWSRSRKSRFQKFVAQVAAQETGLKSADEEELKSMTAALRERLRREGFYNNDELVAETFALIRETARRRLGMRHHDVQLIGGYILLLGVVAEMETGEGKTLTATLAACTAALSAMPVHVITVNDYLARRDAESMGPVYESLGLSVGIVTEGMTPDERRQAYDCDVTYCTNKELVFDYLKDRIVLGNRPGRIRLKLERITGKQSRMHRLVLRGLCFAIVDEADSVLVDEARTPLVISGAGGADEEVHTYEQALAIADQLLEREDFEILERQRSVRLTAKGKIKLEDMAESLGGLWVVTQRREQLVSQALAARHLYFLDRHYLVRDGKVQIIDEYTGRVMADRSWELGLHQMIETKEGCELTGRRETIARISYQRFFRRYLHLAGMTGTAKEIAGELWSVYGLNVVPVPTHKPVRRKNLGTQICDSSGRKWDAVVEHVADIHATGRPVLVGTRSVEASEHLSALLTQKGLIHQVLNARQDKNEAELVEQAGQKGKITVATNMAGRGTDIKLGSGICDIGGLHVVITELHDARRIDRQLIGRCGRQGDNGSYKTIISLEDELLMDYLGAQVLNFVRNAASERFDSLQAVLQLLSRFSQLKAERFHSQIRASVLKTDEKLDRALAFSGRFE